ncbi:MAG: hypothetical protein COB36_10840 [Alphaproteobacteria bacterium]|nr:MAG: hypothetical protein COB36_10840 [Alphaproteobacteria bacterium]
MDDNRSELAIKRDEWFVSDEGQKCMSLSLMYEDNVAKFLRNRLEAAFLAGAEAGLLCQQEICDKTALALSITATPDTE